MEQENKQPKRKKALRIGSVVRSFLPKLKRTLNVEIPKGFYNCGVTTCNHFIADTNDSANWKTLKFPLPKPKGKRWEISRYDIVNDDKTVVELVCYGLL
jgi:hypothetical protein